MSATRRGRLVALVASVLLACLAIVLAPPTFAGPPNCELDPLPLGCVTTTTQASTTTLKATTTTVARTTTSVPRQTTTTRRPTTTTAEEATTSTSDVPSGRNLLIPGDGSEGAQSTTTTMERPGTVSNDGTSDGALLALIVGGLVLLAVAVSILTRRYWVATRPPPSAPVGSGHG